MRFVSNLIVGLAVNLSSESFQLRLPSWAIFEIATANNFCLFAYVSFCTSFGRGSMSRNVEKRFVADIFIRKHCFLFVKRT
jgi:hypothetical protein